MDRFELNTYTFTNNDGEETLLDCADGAHHEVTVRRTNDRKYLIMEVTTEGVCLFNLSFYFFV